MPIYINATEVTTAYVNGHPLDEITVNGELVWEGPPVPFSKTQTHGLATSWVPGTGDYGWESVGYVTSRSQGSISPDNVIPKGHRIISQNDPGTYPVITGYSNTVEGYEDETDPAELLYDLKISFMLNDNSNYILDYWPTITINGNVYDMDDYPTGPNPTATQICWWGPIGTAEEYNKWRGWVDLTHEFSVVWNLIPRETQSLIEQYRGQDKIISLSTGEVRDMTDADRRRVYGN